MKYELGDYCIVITDSWEQLKPYRYAGVNEDGMTLVKEISSSGTRMLSTHEKISLSPFSIRAHRERPPNLELYRQVLDIASSHIGHSPKVLLEDVIDKVCADKRVNTTPEQIICMFQALVVEGYVKATASRSPNQSRCYLELGERQKNIEKRRSFAASMASELESLSNRVRLIISHGPTVGAYREQLLIGILRKHLPERYHIASGFIYDCPRQFDVLIYDRLEYAPLFREGDLVVVPANSVRAVIEVKTTLDKDQLKNSLTILEAAGRHDDGYPPIFKGVFAFESSLKEGSLCDIAFDFYSNGHHPISPPYGFVYHPFCHLTAVCIYKKHYMYTRYFRNGDGRYMPTLCTKRSNIGLESQFAWFIQELLTHLRYGAAKDNYYSQVSEMLGTDTIVETHQVIAHDEWGPYSDDEFITDDDIKSTEERISSVQDWLEGRVDSWKTR